MIVFTGLTILHIYWEAVIVITGLSTLLHVIVHYHSNVLAVKRLEACMHPAYDLSVDSVFPGLDSVVPDPRPPQDWGLDRTTRSRFWKYG